MSRVPRTIWVKVSTPLLMNLYEWQGPFEVRAELEHDDTYTLVFREAEAPAAARPSNAETRSPSPAKGMESCDSA